MDKYAVPEELVVRNDIGYIVINTRAFFEKSSLTKQRQLLAYAFRDFGKNTETIRRIGEYLPRRLCEARSGLEEAVKKYSDEYTAVRLHPELSGKEKKEAEAHNRSLMKNVKHCKAVCRKFTSIISFYETLKNKNEE